MLLVTIAPAAPTKIGDQLDGYMQAQVNRNHFTGAVLVAQNGKVLLAKGYGYANAEWKTPNTLQTKFRLGSLTKQFTATAILQLRAKAGSACRIPYANTFSRALRLGSR
jgi:CubicO group peptidase (beta-lactamase class C family)